AVMTNFTPLFAAIFSIILLNESVHSYHIISAILITAGILICSYKKH
ncbi:TPA: EamA family transporter, partial [Mannheimia haemolytica]|nr:EamA family transporter [Mannheimia haemolytica]